MQSTEEIIADHAKAIEINTLSWAIKLLEKFPVELAISEIKKYKGELENGS